MNEYEKNLIKIKKLKKAKFLLIQKYMILTLDIEEILEIGLDFVIKTSNGDIKNLKYDTWIRKIHKNKEIALEVLAIFSSSWVFLSAKSTFNCSFSVINLSKSSILFL